MNDIYVKIDNLTSSLKREGYLEYSNAIATAKQSGCTGTEILAMILIELKSFKEKIDVNNIQLVSQFNLLLSEVEVLVKLK